MTAKRILLLILAIALLAALTLGCITSGDFDDWDGMERDGDDFNGVSTRQAEGLPTSTPTPTD